MSLKSIKCPKCNKISILKYDNVGKILYSDCGCYQPKDITTINLKSLYNYYNKKYFKNQLPNVNSLQFEWELNKVQPAGQCVHISSVPQTTAFMMLQHFTDHQVGFHLLRKIYISKKYIYYFPMELKIVLIHEMIHLKYKNHGSAFNSEVNRLKKEFGLEIPIHAKNHKMSERYRGGYTQSHTQKNKGLSINKNQAILSYLNK